MLLGNRLKALRLNRNQTQNEIAVLLGISTALYCKIVGDLVGITVVRLFELAEVFETSPEALLGRMDCTVALRNEIETLKAERDKLDEYCLKLTTRLIEAYERLGEEDYWTGLEPRWGIDLFGQ